MRTTLRKHVFWMGIILALTGCGKNNVSVAELDRIVLSVTQASGVLPTGICIPVEVAAFDAQDQLLELAVDSNIVFSFGESSLGVFAESQCETSIVAAEMNAQDDSVTIYIKNIFSESVTLSAEVEGTEIEATLTLNFRHDPVIAAGGSHNCAITATQDAYCWGNNDQGQLGDASGMNQDEPALVSGLPVGVKLLQIFLGSDHSCGVGSDQNIYCWGINDQGQLGDGTSVAKDQPVMVTGLPTGVVLTQISIGGNHGCGIGSDQNTYCWGSNFFGELGDDSLLAKDEPVMVTGLPVDVTLIQISLGFAHSCGIGSDQNTYCWGINGSGQVGDDTTADKKQPVMVTGLPANVTLTQISLGGSHSCGIGSDQNTYCWGNNLLGELGDGTNADKGQPVMVTGMPVGKVFTQVALGGNHSCAMAADGSTHCWGRNSFGQVGDGTSMNRNEPVEVVGLAADVFFTQVSLGGSHSCGVGSDQAFYCWGLNDDGQLGDGGVNPKEEQPLMLDDLL